LKCQRLNPRLRKFKGLLAALFQTLLGKVKYHEGVRNDSCTLKCQRLNPRLRKSLDDEALLLLLQVFELLLDDLNNDVVPHEREALEVPFDLLATS